MSHFDLHKEGIMDCCYSCLLIIGDILVWEIALIIPERLTVVQSFNKLNGGLRTLSERLRMHPMNKTPRGISTNGTTSPLAFMLLYISNEKFSDFSITATDTLLSAYLARGPLGVREPSICFIKTTIGVVKTQLKLLKTRVHLPVQLLNITVYWRQKTPHALIEPRRSSFWMQIRHEYGQFENTHSYCYQRRPPQKSCI
ncbi:hypothetical protein BKA93DRAFT_855899 [Sparassis latifolia]